jgi:hypothetical protein
MWDPGWIKRHWCSFFFFCFLPTNQHSTIGPHLSLPDPLGCGTAQHIIRYWVSWELHLWLGIWLVTERGRFPKSPETRVTESFLILCCLPSWLMETAIEPMAFPTPTEYKHSVLYYTLKYYICLLVQHSETLRFVSQCIYVFRMIHRTVIIFPKQR